MARATCCDVLQRDRLALCLVQFFFVDLSERQKPNSRALNNEPDSFGWKCPVWV